MRLTTTRLAVPIILLALVGCGGSAVVVNNVPGGPVDLKVPGSGQGLDPQATPTATACASETPTEDETATTDPAAGTAEPQADTGTQTTPENGGAEAPATQDPATGTGEKPEAGAPKEEFEDYCAQNPGACGTQVRRVSADLQGAGRHENTAHHTEHQG